MNYTHTETNLSIENQYPKLVRDKIPEMIERDGKIAVTHIAEKEEYVGYLFSKLIEEATELKEAKDSRNKKEEFADVREVLTALQAELGFLEAEIEEIQAAKLADRGGFAGRIILETNPN